MTMTNKCSYEVLLILCVWGGGLLLVLSLCLAWSQPEASPWSWSPNQLRPMVSRQGLPHLFSFFPNTHTYTHTQCTYTLTHTHMHIQTLIICGHSAYLHVRVPCALQLLPLFNTFLSHSEHLNLHYHCKLWLIQKIFSEEGGRGEYMYMYTRKMIIIMRGEPLLVSSALFCTDIICQSHISL